VSERNLGWAHHVRWIAGNVLIRLADAAGDLALHVRNSAGSDALAVRSSGRVDIGGQLTIPDGITAPTSNLTGKAIIYIDSADGDLKIRFSDGTVKTITIDT